MHGGRASDKANDNRAWDLKIINEVLTTTATTDALILASSRKVILDLGHNLDNTNTWLQGLQSVGRQDRTISGAVGTQEITSSGIRRYFTVLPRMKHSLSWKNFVPKQMWVNWNAKMIWYRPTTTLVPITMGISTLEVKMTSRRFMFIHISAGKIEKHAVKCSSHHNWQDAHCKSRHSSAQPAWDALGLSLTMR